MTTKEYWVAAALTDDALVAELLLRLKHSDSSDAHPPPVTATTTTTATATVALVGWGNRKSRSKPGTTTTAVANGFRKEPQRGSPTTPLSWSGVGTGAGVSTSDGYDESSRPSDLSSGGRSNKAGYATNEGASTSSYNKSKKRKSFVELKEEEGVLLKERVHLNIQLASMRVTLNHQIATSENLKRIKIDLHQKPEKEIETTPEREPQTPMQALSSINKSAQMSCKVEAEIKTQDKGFVLPDLNMTPSEEELATMI